MTPPPPSVKRFLAAAVLAVWVLSGGTAFCVQGETESVRGLFAQGNGAYRDGDYGAAARRYREILENGVENGALYYNLGNALLKSGRNSEAYWAYLKAERFLSQDADLKANLNYAQALLASAGQDSIRPGPWVKYLTFGGTFSSGVLAFWLGICLWLAVVLRLLDLWVPVLRKGIRPLAWPVGLGAGLFLLALAAQTLWVDSVARGVMTPAQVEVRFSPQESGTTHFTLSEGAVVELLSREFGWVQVRRADGLAGWVKEGQVKGL